MKMLGFQAGLSHMYMLVIVVKPRYLLMFDLVLCLQEDFNHKQGWKNLVFTCSGYMRW